MYRKRETRTDRDTDYEKGKFSCNQYNLILGGVTGIKLQTNKRKNDEVFLRQRFIPIKDSITLNPEVRYKKTPRVQLGMITERCDVLYSEIETLPVLVNDRNLVTVFK